MGSNDDTKMCAVPLYQRPQCISVYLFAGGTATVYIQRFIRKIE